MDVTLYGGFAELPERVALVEKSHADRLAEALEDAINTCGFAEGGEWNAALTAYREDKGDE